MCITAAFLLVALEIGSNAAESGKMKIQIRVDDQIATAMLLDTVVARDFASLLPLSLTLTDYAAIEKISDLPRKLSAEGTQTGEPPAAAVGDITYYSPWGNLAIFHQRFRYSAGLVKLGHIDEGLDFLARSGPIKVTIERLP
jgi:hypothetical protein